MSPAGEIEKSCFSCGDSSGKKEECRTEKFILQKLNYMHQNPCVGRWGLCKNTYDYAHSSAAFYEKDNRTNKLLRDYREFMGLLLELEERERMEQNR
jgi:hypothetical protein